MLSGDFFRDALPDWTQLRGLDEVELEAGADLLVALTQLAGLSLESDIFQSLKTIWIDLFCGYDELGSAALSAHIDTSYGRIQRLFEHPHAFGVLLASACSRLRSQPAQFHLLCLLIITVFSCGPDERQIELGYRIGKKFNMPEERVEELFSRLWTAFHQARAAHKGLEIQHDYVQGTNWQRQKVAFQSTANPFEMPRR